jgi:hypothetical protein
MKRALKIFLPFALTFVVGTFVARVFVTKIAEPKIVQTPTNSRIEVLSTPKIDFTEPAKHSLGLQASVRLSAVIDGNGNVASVTPSVMLPYGKRNGSSKEFVVNTPMLLNGRFVNELPYQLGEVAINLVRSIKFKPEIVNGIAQRHLVTVIVQYWVTEPLGFCNPITATIFDDHGEFWSGNVSIYQDCGRGNNGID